MILLDVNMPGMDGFELAELIRHRQRSEHTPIIFVSAVSQTNRHMFKGYALGAVDYLYAPIPEVLRAKVAVFIELFKRNEEVKRQNADLQRLAVELETANKELEAFSYSVSHDLRAPLRAVNGFTRILLEDYAPHLPLDAQRYLQRVHESSEHMSQLVDTLLAFSRLSRQPLNKRPVAPADLVRQVLENLRSEQQERRIEITVGVLPSCQADPALLEQVFVNLLSNALKFTSQREVAHIEIGCQPMNGEQVYFVKDNGVGFDMQYAHKLFGVFQRLHRAEEYEGVGAGLAIVQRIIHRHSGQIWVEAAVNHSATFFFTLGEEGTV